MTDYLSEGWKITATTIMVILIAVTSAASAIIFLPFISILWILGWIKVKLFGEGDAA